MALQPYVAAYTPDCRLDYRNLPRFSPLQLNPQSQQT